MLDTSTSIGTELSLNALNDTLTLSNIPYDTNKPGCISYNAVSFTNNY